MSKGYLPDFIGIGAMKSATSWIAACLNEHPEVCMATQKELDFFLSPYLYRKGLAYYRSQFAHCPIQSVKGEYSPQYMACPEAAGRIEANCPQAKLFACLRNPIDRAFSEYRYCVEKRHRLSIYRTFEDALHRDPGLIERGMYFKQLSRFWRLFRQEQLRVLIHDDIPADPARFMMQLYSFLGLKDSIFIAPALMKKENVSGEEAPVQSRFPRLDNALYSLMHHVERLAPGRLLTIIRSTGVGPATGRLMGLNRMNTPRQTQKSSPTPVAPMQERTRIFLSETYREDVLKLAHALDRDLASLWLTL